MRTLLRDPARGPVLALGTLCPVYWDLLSSRPTSSRDDSHSQARELLAGRHLRVADSFAPKELESVRHAAKHDMRLDRALREARDGRITQFLAGAPALLERYEQAPAMAQAVLTAAMDARRLGCGVRIPRAFLEYAATGYLPETVYDTAQDDWFDRALAYTAQPVHGDLAPLHQGRHRPGEPAAAAEPFYKLADYLEQHGRQHRQHACPPASFWDAALAHLNNASDLTALAQADADRWRRRHAALLDKKAARYPWPDWSDDEIAELYGPDEYDEPAPAPNHLTCSALADLALRHEHDGEHDEATDLAYRAADCCQPEALATLALIRERSGRREESPHLAHHAAARGFPECLTDLSQLREEAGLHEEAEHFAWEAARHGQVHALAVLADARETAGLPEKAEALWNMAARCNHPEALANVARLRQAAGDQAGAEECARAAVDRCQASPWQHKHTPLWVTQWPHGLEPDGTPTPAPGDPKAR